MTGHALVTSLLAASCLVGGPRVEDPGSGRSPNIIPNIIIVFADDLGYGDLGCYGHPSIRTSHLDRMAAEGMRFTQFYSAAPVCTPSRAALLTGRLPVRSGLCHDRIRVLFPNSLGGLPDEEVTIAEALRSKGYATACIGKWHLGHLPRYLPTRHGFDEYYGIPYSNDMRPTPILRGEKVIEEPAEQRTLTRRYTEEALRFIDKNRDRPFFLYLPHTMPHVPLHASNRFRGTSPRGLYGDVVEEIDWSVGEILERVRRLGLEKRTFAFFTSDNGPWLIKKQNGGSAGLLRGGKGSTWEGGVRVPGIAWWPGKIRAGSTTRALGNAMDLFTTSLKLAGVDLPRGRTIDGKSLLPVLFSTGDGERRLNFYYRGTRLMALRKGPWKAHFISQPGYGRGPEAHDPPLLFHLEHDPSERYDVAGKHAGVIEDILREVERHRSELRMASSQLEARVVRQKRTEAKAEKKGKK